MVIQPKLHLQRTLSEKLWLIPTAKYLSSPHPSPVTVKYLSFPPPSQGDYHEVLTECQTSTKYLKTMLIYNLSHTLT